MYVSPARLLKIVKNLEKNRGKLLENCQGLLSSQKVVKIAQNGRIEGGMQVVATSTMVPTVNLQLPVEC